MFWLVGFFYTQWLTYFKVVGVFSQVTVDIFDLLEFVAPEFFPGDYFLGTVRFRQKHDKRDNIFRKKKKEDKKRKFPRIMQETV